MKKLIIVVLFCMCFLCGCRQEYDRNDVKEYLKTEYGLKDISVSRQPEEVEDSQGYTNYLWKVDDHKHKISFHVLDDAIEGLFGISNSLWSDYEDVRLMDAFQDYTSDNLYLETVKTKEQMYRSNIAGDFDSRSELKALFDETNQFLESYLDGEIKTSVRFYMDNPYRHNVEDYEVDDGDYITTQTLLTEEMYEEAESDFLRSAVDYGFDDMLEAFTYDEICEAIIAHRSRIGIATSKEGPYTYYDDLCASQLSYGISFSTLYQILEREGYPIEGDKNHYSFVGVDGSTYELSYDFVGYIYEDAQGGPKAGYYYKKDGVDTPMEYYFYNHFRADWVAEKTGIYFQEQWREQQNKSEE